jgi:excisionase family DNA binding protein
MLTVKEAATRIGISSATVYALCTARQLRHSRVGLGRGKIVISDEAVAEYLRVRESGPAQLEPPPVPLQRRKSQTLRLEHLRLPGA